MGALNPPPVALGSLFLAVYGLVAARLSGTSVDVTFDGYGFVGTAVAVLGIYNLARLLRGHFYLEKIARFVGENALAVYILPWLVTYPFSRFILSFASPGQRVVVAVPCCLALIAGAALLGRTFTKTRVGKFLLSV